MTQKTTDDVTKLASIKKNIEESFKYFEKNYKRFQEFLRFVCVTTLTDNELAVLAQVGKPPLQFNILEAIVSKQRGEFMSHEPSITVKAADGVDLGRMGGAFLETMRVLEAHLREIINNSNNDQMQYKCYSDLLIGGFSVVEVYTDYSNEFSFEQNIFTERVHNPCLAGFDPQARLSHKGDGNYCFKMIPLTKDDFIARFGNEAAKDINFYTSSSVDGFKWAYKNSDKKIVLIAEYFEKVKTTKEIVRLAKTDLLFDENIKNTLMQNGIKLRETMLESDYNKMLKIWEQLFSYAVIPPFVVDKRKTTLCTIDKYTITDGQILSKDKTNFEHLPLVFFDGNSVEMQTSNSDSYEQVTRPMVYHAKGLQKMKDFAGQTLVSEIENIIQQTLSISEEALPSNQDFQEAYLNPQKRSLLIWKQFSDRNPNVPLSAPQVVQRQATPPIVPEAFMAADKLLQNTLGMYDAEIGIQGGDISGKAIQQGAMQSSAAAKPYLMGYIQGLNRLADIIVSLIPKYYLTPRTIPILNDDGKREYVVINDEQMPGAVMMDYDSHDLMVNVEAGASFGVQKQLAMEQMIKLMQINPEINQFMADKGAPILLDNIEFRNSDLLKQSFEDWKQEQEAQKQQAKQLQQKAQDLDMAEKQASVNLAQSIASSKMMDANTKAEKEKQERLLEIAKFIHESKIDEEKLKQNAAKITIASQEANLDAVKVMADVEQSQIEAALTAEKVSAERQRTEVDAVIAASKHLHDIKTKERDVSREMLRNLEVSPQEINKGE